MFTSNLKRLNLATQTYVDTEIDANIPDGTVTEITPSTGLSIAGGGESITTSGTLILDAELNDLSNVSGTPVADQVLGWDGTSTWIPMTFIGSGTSSVQWDSLTNVDSLTGAANYIMKVNNDSTRVELVQNNLVYGPDIISGEGMTHSIVNSSRGVTLRLDTKLSELLVTPTSGTDTTMVIVDEDDNQRRIQFSDVSLGNFKNDTQNPYLRSDGISAVDPVAFDRASTTFSLTQNRYEIDFDVAETFGIVGTLSIEHGGTSGSTAAEARDYLGLEYNSDIMAYTGPEYVDTMKGNDILIRPNYLRSTTLVVDNPGTGYTPGEATVQLDDNSTFTIDITTGASGVIESATAQNSSGFNFLDWGDGGGTSGSVLGGSDGEVTIYPQTGYINFGQLTGYSGYGIGYDGNFWFKDQTNDEWLNTIPFDLQDANNVESNPSSLEAGMILIYDGTSEFTFQEMNGDVTINRYGTTSITTGSIDPNVLIAVSDSLEVNITPEEFGTLNNINTDETIQDQLNGKIGVSQMDEGDMVYYNGSSWELLNYPSNRNYVITSTGISAPTWDYVSTTYEVGTSYSVGDSILYLDNSHGTSATYTIEMDEILREHCGSSGGMAIPGTVLSTDLAGLPDVTSFNVSDFYLAVNNPSIADPLDERIGVSEFLSYAAGSGLVHSSGVLNLDTNSDIIPDIDVTYDLGSTTYAWERVYLQKLNLDPYDTFTAYTLSGSTPEEGELIYVRDDTGAGGDPCLGVRTNSAWMKINLSTI